MGITMVGRDVEVISGIDLGIDDVVINDHIFGCIDLGVCDGLREHGTPCLDHAAHDALGNADVPDRAESGLTYGSTDLDPDAFDTVSVRDIPADFDYPVETHMPGAGINLVDHMYFFDR